MINLGSIRKSRQKVRRKLKAWLPAQSFQIVSRAYQHFKNLRPLSLEVAPLRDAKLKHPSVEPPATAEDLAEELTSARSRGQLNTAVSQAIKKHTSASEVDKKALLQTLLAFAPARDVASAATRLGVGADPYLQLDILKLALETGDVNTAETAYSAAEVSFERPIEMDLAEASLLSHTGKGRVEEPLRRVRDHPRAAFKHLLSGLLIADNSFPDLVPSFLAKMSAIATGAHRLTAARYKYEMGADPNLGFATISALLRDKKLSNAAAHWIGRYLRHSGYVTEAAGVLRAIETIEPDNERVLLELAEVAIELDDFEGALASVERARKLMPAGKEIFAPAEFTALAQANHFAAAWSLYKKRATHKHLREGYLQSRYTSNYQRWAQSPNRLLAAVSGLGDEIRWSSGYCRLPNDGETIVTCDPRLLPLFQRSYPERRFLPVRRRFKVVDRTAGDSYSSVPSGELTYFFDNNGWAAAQGAGQVTTMYDAMSGLFPDRESFNRPHPTLSVDTDKLSKFQNEAPTDLPRIAISWRSDLLSYARTQHYAPIELVVELMRARKAYYYILQDTLSSDEKSALSAFEFTMASEVVDTRNDLDSTAAWFKGLDAVIAPATANFELAGAVGAPAIMMSRSGHVKWRTQADGSDIWFPTVKHARIPLHRDLDGKHLSRDVINILEAMIFKGSKS